MNTNFASYLFMMTALCISATNDSQCILVADSYPHAHQWYQAMSKKYPQAQLKKVPFCVGETFQAINSSIFWPQYSLQQLEIIYQKIINNQVLSSPEKQILLQQEYILLHESAHLIKSHQTRGALTILATSISIYGYYQLLYQIDLIEDELTKGITFAVGSTALASAGTACIRMQEDEADEFANEQGEKEILQAGANWYAYLSNYEPSGPIAWMKSFFALHPPSTQRSQKASLALKKRFT